MSLAQAQTHPFADLCRRALLGLIDGYSHSSRKSDEVFKSSMRRCLVIVGRENKMQSRNFNPCRTRVILMLAQVSIHAPARGATCLPDCIFVI